MAGLSDVIAGALNEARTAGDIGAEDTNATEVETPVVENDETPEAEVAEGDEEAITPEEGEEEDSTSNKTTVDADESGEEAEVKPVEAKPTTPKVEDQEDATLKAEGVRMKDKHGRPNRLPYDRVVAITRNAVSKVHGVVAKVVGLDAKTITADNFESTITEALKDVPALRARAKGFDELEPIMMDDPDTFIQALASDPKFGKGYAKFLAVLDPGFKAPSEEAATVDEANDPEPQPDVDMGEGKPKQFSVEQWKRHEEWRDRAADRRAEARLNKRLKPFEDAQKKDQQIAETRRQYDARVKSALGEMMQLEGFEANREEIRKGMNDFASKSLEFAMVSSYLKTMIPKWKAEVSAEERQKIRTERDEELKKLAVKQTATTMGTSTKKASTEVGGGKRTGAQVIADAVKAHKAGRRIT